MASVDDYRDFGESLSNYVNASDSSELTDAFKAGGALYNALKSLDTQEEELNRYQESLLESFHPGQEGSLTQEQVNQQIEKNDDVRNEIVHLQARLNDLSESVGSSKGNWNVSRAKSEFTEGVKQGLKVENGFFSILVNSIKNAFSFTSSQKIEAAKTNISEIINDIQSNTEDRIEVPGKDKLQEKNQRGGIKSPTVSTESSKVITPNIEMTKSNIPVQSQTPEGASAKKNNIPGISQLQNEEVGLKISPSEDLLKQKFNEKKDPMDEKD